MESTQLLFEEMCSEMFYIVSNLSMWKPDNPIPAGELKACFTNWPSDGNISFIKAHFLAARLGSPGMEDFPLNQHTLKELYSKHVKFLKGVTFLNKTYNLKYFLA